jgi:phage protein|nr:MAG TPA: Protein of unknown function (DUF1642) [Caudoviricetes sp.]
MNIQGLIERYEKFKASKKKMTSVDLVLKDLRTLDEPEPLPFKLKDVVRRIRGFYPTTQTRWLNDILKELGDDYGSMKYREGYEQGKFEGAWVGNQLKDADKIRQELNKPVIPQFVAVWIEECKAKGKNLLRALLYTPEKVNSWVDDPDNQEIFALAWILGYEVEEEKQYRIKLKSNSKEIDYLVNTERNELRFYSTIYTQRREHTRKELEDAGFGWVFDCPGIEVEEVE